jgi:hypothetical protein
MVSGAQSGHANFPQAISGAVAAEIACARSDPRCEDDQYGCASVRVRDGLGRLRPDAWRPRLALVFEAHRIEELTARELT